MSTAETPNRNGSTGAAMAAEGPARNGSNISDRALRSELLRLRADLQRQELADAVHDLRDSFAPLVRAFQAVTGVLDSAPAKGAMGWVWRHPLAGALASLLLGRLGSGLLSTGFGKAFAEGAGASRGVIRRGVRLVSIGLGVGASIIAGRWLRSRRGRD